MKGKGKLKVSRGGRRSFSKFPEKKPTEDGSQSSEEEEEELEEIGLEEGEPETVPEVKAETETKAEECAISEKVRNLNIENNQRMSRKEKEALDQKLAKERYWKLHMECKTDQAKADLARLAQVKKRREEEAKKKELEKQAKEAAKIKR